MTQPEIHTFTVETTGDGPSSVASGRLPDPIQTFIVDTAGPAPAEYRIPTPEQMNTVPTAAQLIASGWCPPFDDPEALREMASQLLTWANAAEARR